MRGIQNRVIHSFKKDGEYDWSASAAIWRELHVYGEPGDWIAGCFPPHEARPLKIAEGEQRLVGTEEAIELRVDAPESHRFLGGVDVGAFGFNYYCLLQVYASNYRGDFVLPCEPKANEQTK